MTQDRFGAEIYLTQAGRAQNDYEGFTAPGQEAQRKASRRKRNRNLGKIKDKYYKTEKALSEDIEVLNEKRDREGELSESDQIELRRRRRKLRDHRSRNLAKRLEAEQGIAKSALLLVGNIAKGYHAKTGVELDELISCGNQGLMRAAQKFEQDRGLNFATYASYWINQAIRRGLGEMRRTNRLPAYANQVQNRLENIEGTLMTRLERTPTREELSQEYKKIYGDRELTAASALLELRDRTSQSIGDPSEADWSELPIEDREVTPPLELLCHRERLRELKTYLESDEVDEREKLVLKYRFGLCGRKQKTLKEIGEELGVTRERVRQIEREAIKHLREYFKAPLEPENTRYH